MTCATRIPSCETPSSLGVYPGITETQIDYIGDVFRKFFKRKYRPSPPPVASGSHFPNLLCHIRMRLIDAKSTQIYLTP